MRPWCRALARVTPWRHTSCASHILLWFVARVPLSHNLEWVVPRRYRVGCLSTSVTLGYVRQPFSILFALEVNAMTPGVVRPWGHAMWWRGIISVWRWSMNFVSTYLGPHHHQEAYHFGQTYSWHCHGWTLNPSNNTTSLAFFRYIYSLRSLI
jgi:hypothetical protein